MNNRAGATKHQQLQHQHQRRRPKRLKQTGDRVGPHHQIKDSHLSHQTVGPCLAVKELEPGAQPITHKQSQKQNQLCQHRLQQPIPGEHHKHQPPAWMVWVVWALPEWAIWAQLEWRPQTAASICKRNNQWPQPGDRNQLTTMLAGIKQQTGAMNQPLPPLHQLQHRLRKQLQQPIPGHKRCPHRYQLQYHLNLLQKQIWVDGAHSLQPVAGINQLQWQNNNNQRQHLPLIHGLSL